MAEPKKLTSLSVKVYDNGKVDIRAAFAPNCEAAMGTLLSSMLNGDLPLAIITYMERAATNKAKKKSLEKVIKHFNMVNEQLQKNMEKQLKDNAPVVGPREVFADMVKVKGGRRG